MMELREVVPNVIGDLPLELPALHYCAQTGDFPTTILTLVAGGADINEMDDQGMTVLHWACARHRTDTVAALLSVPHLNINKGRPGKDRPIHTALEWYKWGRREKLRNIPLMILKDSRVDINAPGVSSSVARGLWYIKTLT